MTRHLSLMAVVSGLALLAGTGCRPQQPFYFHQTGGLDHYVGVATDLEYPNVETQSLDEVTHGQPPLSLDNPKPKEMWDLSLQEVMQIALTNGTVLKSLGGVSFGPTGVQGTPAGLLQNAAGAATTFIPSLVETDARTGTEAALAAFDTQFTGNIGWDGNVNPQNASGFLSQFQPQRFTQDLASAQIQLGKTAADGSEWFIRHNVSYERNNVDDSLKLFPAAWTINVEAETRIPFLQGSGVQFNRIAGPGSIPGLNNGVMIARVRVDQSLADFEGSVRNFVADVERSYWNLYYAYRRLDTAIEGRDKTLVAWRGANALLQTGSGPKIPGQGQTANLEAQARQQYYQFQASVKQSQTNLYKTEAVLRYMMGLAASDGRLIYPNDKPVTAPVKLDWEKAYGDALVRSVELRKQKWRIKQAELELIASKNWLLPRLDLVAKYRFAGMGAELINPDRETDASGHLLDSYSSMTSGAYPSWHIGPEFKMPLGFRREMAGVRNAELQLTRERKVLQEQELELQHQVDDAFRDVYLNFSAIEDNYNRMAAAVTDVQVFEALVQGQKMAPAEDAILRAYLRLSDAQDTYYRSLADYSVAIMQLHLRMGSLLEYDGVCLTEGPWPAKAYFDARRRARARDAATYVNYGFTQPKVVSRGPFPQDFSATDASMDMGQMPVGGQVMPRGSNLEPIPTPAPAMDDSSTPTMQPIPNADQARARTVRQQPAGTSVADARTAATRPSQSSGVVPASATSSLTAKSAPSTEGVTGLVGTTAADQNKKAGGTAYDLGSLNLTGLNEPIATSPAVAPDQSASGWKATQH
jgi:outer membrane protein TolC